MIRQRRSLFVAPAVAALSGLLWAGSPARAADPAPNTRPNDPRPADSRDWVGNDEIRPGDSRARDPHDRDLRDPDPRDMRRDHDRRPRGPVFDSPNNGGGSPGFSQDFPSEDVHEWVVANARAANARASFSRAQSDLNQSVRDVQFHFEQSQDTRAALRAEREAYEAYTAARQKALQSVVNDVRYQAAIRLRDETGEQIRRLRASNSLAREELLALASLKLGYAADARAMEVAALDADGSLKDARQRMVDASAKVSDLRAHFEASLRDNPDLLAARRAVADARIKYITAQAYLEAAVVAGARAVDYAYYLRSPTRGTVFNDYGYDYLQSRWRY